MSRVGRSRLRLLGAALLTLSAGTAALTAGSASPAAAAAPPASDGSAVTVTGSPSFPNLSVTVSKTTQLVDEVVQVSWKGFTPTRGNFGLDYLQIMQCWGDDPKGPEREQCQFGGLTGDSRGGAFVSSRQVTYDVTDPRETYRATKPNGVRYVPFRSVTGKTTEGGLSEFFDGSTTNEVPYGGTRADGGGIVPFEVQTAAEAPGLGCGVPRQAVPSSPTAPGPALPTAPSGASPAASGAASATPTARSAATSTSSTAPSATTAASGSPTASPSSAGEATATGPIASGTEAAPKPGQRCWLVVVPRGEREVDGSLRTPDLSRQLLSSPLSQSNWDQRLVVPLDFVALGKPCPLGKAERPIIGQESAVEAVVSWQPTLCAGNGPVYSYNQLSDILSRSQALNPSPPLAVTTQPIAPDAVPAGRTAVYAPIVLSGITVAFNIDSQSALSAPPEVKARDGQRISELNLTPRLVAKLLTQSYRVAAAQGRKGLEKNPLDLTRDPDFRKSNPAFAQLSYTGIGGIIVPAGLSDTNGLVWRWILADKDAAAFLAGTPDPGGMVVNPAYKGLGQQDGFPKSDDVCTAFLTAQPPLCTLDAFPYAGDRHEGARAAARGDTLSRSNYDETAIPPGYKRSPPQPTGSRALLAITDTATAARYDLQTASLRNSSGAFVAPDSTGLLAGVAAMTPSEVRSVLRPAPTTTAPKAYPLTNLSYAVGIPGAMDAAARKDYDTFLRYAAGPGQTPGVTFGTLPLGDVPLPASQRTQTLAAAATIGAVAKLASPGAGSTPRTTKAAAPGGNSGSGDTGSGTAGFTGGSLDGPITDPGLTGSSTTGLDPQTLPVDPVPATVPLDTVLPPAPAGGGTAGASAVPAPQTEGSGATLAARVPTPAEPAGFARYGVVLTLGVGGAAALGGSFLRRTRPLRPRSRPLAGT